MLTTRGIGGQSQCVPTGGYGPYLFGDTEPEEDGDEFGGEGKYDVVARRIYTRTEPGEPALTEKNVFVPHETKPAEVIDTILEIDGDDYRVALGEWPTAKQAVAELPTKALERRLQDIQKEWNIPKREAFVKLAARAAKELKATKALKESLVQDDEDFIIILVAADA